MPWIDRLDATATRWPMPARWSYLGVKWSLVALGGFLMIRMALDRTGLWPLFY